MSESINERIKAIRKYFCNDSNIEFANKLNISRQAANNYVRDGYIVGKSVIDKITDVFPEVNISWIITGDGYMLKNAETQMINRLELLAKKIESETPFLDKLGYDKNELRAIIEKDIPARNELIGDLNEINPNININWLLTGKGEMLRNVVSEPNYQYDNTNNSDRGKLIPVYDDSISFGGYNGRAADTNAVVYPSEYINTGDWFRDATAAIRHYGDSMIEYPQGCLLALKEVYERQLVVWGRDYVIETNEYRITKRVQRGNDDDHIRAYSSNTETYPDGQLIHEPIDILWGDIRRIFLVLGCVIKSNGGTIISTNQK